MNPYNANGDALLDANGDEYPICCVCDKPISGLNVEAIYCACGCDKPLHDDCAVVCEMCEGLFIKDHLIEHQKEFCGEYE